MTQTSQAGFEVQTCTRCLGSGNYSWNRQDGTRCYGCWGSGTVHTKRGKAGYKRYLDNLSRPAHAIAVGDIIDVGQNGKVNFGRVQSVKEHFGGLLFTTKYNTLYSEVDGLVLCKPATVEIRDAAKAEALAYQANLTKQGQPRKRRARA